VKDFWKHQVRYRVAKFLMDCGIRVMPDTRYKREMLDALWALHDKVVTTVSGRS
jgi:hypothetical protein